MKLETTAGMLKAALDTVGRAVEKNHIPILGTVKFERDTVEACNLDMSIKVKMPTRGAAGAACIPHRPLRALLGHVPQDETLTISAGKDGATVTFGLSRYDLPVCDAADFPSIDLGELQALPVDGDGLKKALAFTIPFVSTEETRYYLNGVCLDGKQAIATDGHRLAAHPLGFDATAFDRGIIPFPAASALLAMPPLKTMAVSKAKLAISLAGGSVSIRAKLIDGTFPDWQRVVPTFTDAATELVVDRKALSRVARRMGSIASSRFPGLCLAWSENSLALVSSDRTDGLSSRERMAACANKGGHVGFNLRYLSNVLYYLTSDVVSVSTEGQGHPTLWRGDGDAFLVLMPLRNIAEDLATATAMLANGAAAPREVAA